MKRHTCNYPISLDREIEAEGKYYYVAVEATIDFDGYAEPVENSIEIEYALVSFGEGENMAVIDQTNAGDRVRVPNPVLERAIDDALWESARRYAEDHHGEICLDVAEDYEMARAEWFRE
jgi:hypothetical protein